MALFPLSYGRSMRCPHTGLMIAKDIRENVQIRREMLKAAQGNPKVQADLMAICRESIYIWMNYFCWTYRQWAVRSSDGHEVRPRAAHVPFITRPCQDYALQEFEHALSNGEDVLVSKSRQEGASVLCVGDHNWRWLFEPETRILVVSRVEDLVDKTGDHLALFWKHDYINRFLPDWMLPASKKELTEKGQRHRKDMVLLNPRNGSAITGTATTEHISRGGNYAIVFFDEMAAMETAAAAWRAAENAAVQRRANSTVIGPGTEYSRLRALGEKKGVPRVVHLMYHNNEERAWDREQAIDTDGTVTGHAKRIYWNCRWLKWRIREGDMVDIGQNVFADDIQAGDLVFRSQVITAHKEKHGRAPLRCSLSDDGKRFIPAEHGKWFVWCDLKEDINRPGEFLRKDLTADHVSFLDPSYGKGKANHACPVMDRKTHEVVAEFVDPFMDLNDLAEELVSAWKGIFKGPRGSCFFGWEENGPGENFYKEVVDRLRFRRVYRRRKLGATRDTRTRAYGWRSGRREKKMLMQNLSSAYNRHDIIDHSIPALDEALLYVHFEDGSIGLGTTRDLSTGAREAHGDRVVGRGGCLFLLREVSRFEGNKKAAYPKGTMGELLGHNQVLGLSHG